MGWKFVPQKVGNIQLEKRKKIQEKPQSLVANNDWHNQLHIYQVTKFSDMKEKCFN